MDLAAALTFAGSAADAPDAETIHALKKRFPDEGG
jgi:hypothetical protein